MRFAISVAGGLFLFAQAACAAPTYFDCDSNEGSYSAVVQIHAGPAYRLSGTVTPRQWRNHSTWLPTAQMRLDRADHAASLVLQVVRQPGARQADISVIVATNGETRSAPLGRVGLNEVLRFELQLSTSGDAVLIAGNERRALPFDAGLNASVRVNCSTGQFVFQGVEFGD